MIFAKNALSFSTLAMAGAIFAVASLSTSANASVTSDLLNCKYNTKQKTISCCQQVIRGKKLPHWFKEANSSCNAVAKCVGGGGTRGGPAGGQGTRGKCYIYIPEIDDRDGGRGQNPPRNPSRGQKD